MLSLMAPGESQEQAVPFRLPEGPEPGTLFTNTAGLRTDQTALAVSAFGIGSLHPDHLNRRIMPGAGRDSRSALFCGQAEKALTFKGGRARTYQ
ncbi:hypothetical protein [Paenibacillus chitinolyticus]|uniref:hypothetical protein n=1 Tax=Paenibacillus chitinolyticus TaxID=79263 RepID=UPI00366E584E